MLRVYLARDLMLDRDVNLTSTTVVPVVDGGYGHTNTVYIDPVLAIGYGYTLQGTNLFHTYQIPDPLPQGDDMFTIVHDNIAYDLAAGQVFDFTTIDPLGVDSFLLLGIDPAELIDAEGDGHPPFVYGATFMTPGITEVTTFPLIDLSTESANGVPEPTTLVLTLVALLALGPRVTRRRGRA